MKTSKSLLTFAALMLLGSLLCSHQSTAAQTPQPTPSDPRYAEAETAFSDAARLYTEHTRESMIAALERAEKARRLFNASSAPMDEAMSLLLLSHINNDLGEKREALKNSQQALPIIRKLKEKGFEGSTLRAIGTLHAELGETEKALEAYKQALAVYKELGDKKSQAVILDMIADMYKGLAEKRKTLEYLNQALPLYKDAGDKEGVAATLNNLGVHHSELGEKRKALEYFSQALPLMREVGNKAGEATTLYNLGGVYQDLGERQRALEYSRQALSRYQAADDQDGAAAALQIIGRIHLAADEPHKALEAFNQSLALQRALGNKRGEALSLIHIGKLTEDGGEPQKALEAFEPALAIYKELGDKRGEAVALNRIGIIHDNLGQKQKASEYFTQSLALRRAIKDRAGEAATLESVGTMHYTAGDGQKALEYLSRALLLARADGDKAKESHMLNSIGLVYDDLGERQRALEYLNQSLSLSKAMGDRGREATTLSNMGKVYDALGEPQRALEYFGRALLLREAVADKAGQAVTLNNLAMIYYDLGERGKALAHLTKALEILRATGDKRSLALVLGNLGLSYFRMGEKQKAFDHTIQALELCKAIGEKAGEGRFLSNLGRMYLDAGEKQKASEYLSKALPIRRAVGDKIGEAATLDGLGELLYESGDYQKSSEYLLQGVLLQRAAGDKVAESMTLGSLATVWRELKNRRLAIFYGKQAVARYQELRGAMRGIDRTSQQSFVRTVELPFRELSALLIEDGRLAEAHQVLNIFKDQEFYDAIRPRSTSAAQARPPDMTRREREAAELYRAATDRVAAANRPLFDLEFKLKRSKPTADEEHQLRQLRARVEAAGREAEAALRQIEASFARPASEQDKLASTSETVEMQTALRELSQQTNSPTVALYTIAGGEKFHVLLVTQDKLTSASTPVSPAELVGGILGDRRARRDGLWLLLQSPFYDPRPQSKEIYDIVFKPIEPEIKRLEATAGVESPGATVTLMWSLDWYLRYVPMAALYDGERYLAERYRNVVFTRANRERMTRPVSPNWIGLGFGSAAPQTVKLFSEERFYDALPGVEVELAALFGTPHSHGIMTGRTWLNEQFTKEAFLDALKQRRQLVHLASHFTFEPGDEARSFLLLGKGEVMTLEEMKKLEGLFTGVDLLTLSACNTGAQQFGAEGSEIDGFAELAQRLGAGAVLATLWPVSDASTPQLMAEFYRLRHEGAGKTKAEALREAQVAFLKGNQRATPRPAISEQGGARRKIGRADIFGLKDEPMYTPPYDPDVKAPLAHPYYWAAFVLIGNGR